MSVLRTIDLGQYMDEVMTGATSLNDDVANDADRDFFASQQFIGPWEHFQEQAPYSIEGEPGAGAVVDHQEDLLNPIVSTSTRTAGLIDFYERNRDLADRVVRTEEIWRRTAAFEKELIKFYKQYRADGGTTTKEDPVEGFIPKEDEIIQDLKDAAKDAKTAGGIVLVIGVLLGVGYAVNAVKR